MCVGTGESYVCVWVQVSLYVEVRIKMYEYVCVSRLPERHT